VSEQGSITQEPNSKDENKQTNDCNQDIFPESWHYFFPPWSGLHRIFSNPIIAPTKTTMAIKDTIVLVVSDSIGAYPEIIIKLAAINTPIIHATLRDCIPLPLRLSQKANDSNDDNQQNT